MNFQDIGFVRESRYRNLYGVLGARNTAYENIKVGICKSDNYLKCNSQFFAVPWKTNTGSSIFVRKIGNTGRVFELAPHINGAHKNVLTDFEFNPFVDTMLVSSALDSKVREFMCLQKGIFLQSKI